MMGIGDRVALDDLPLRDNLRGKSAYGAPQLDVAVRLGGCGFSLVFNRTATSS